MALPTASDNVFPKVIMAEGAAPATPSANQVKLYAKADGLLYSKDDAGTETLVSGGAGGLSDHNHTGGGDGGDLDAPIIDGYAVFNEESAPSTPAAATVAVYAKADGLMYSKDDAGTETLMSGGAGGGGGTLTDATATLGSDVALSTSSFTDILSVSLAAGTWVVWATALVHNDSSGACGVTVEIWDGTTTYGSGDVVISGSDVRASIPVLSEKIVLGSTTTIKLSGKTVANNAHALASTTSTSTTKATRMYALKVA